MMPCPQLSPGQQMELWNLFDGTTDNDCKDPATTTTTTVHRLAEYPARLGVLILQLNF